MNLDELRKEWSARDAQLERVIRLQVKTLRTSGPALRRLTWLLWWEVATSAVLVLLFGSFLGDHITEWKFAIPGAALHLCAIALLGFGIQQLVVLRTHYDAPVVELQRKLATMRIHRIRATQLTLLAGTLLWVPVLLVFVRGVFGVDAYLFLPMRWILGNIAFGLVFIPIAILIAKRFPSAPLARSLAGKTMNDAVAFLEELGEP